MSERTPMEKLAGIKIELVTLKPRLSEPYRSNIEQCIGWCRDLIVWGVFFHHSSPI